MANYDREARAALESAISTLVLLYPLYGTVFLYLNKIERTDMPTMAVGTTRRVDLALYYNPDFVKKLTSTQIRAVLKHEALHILLHHISRNQYFGFNMKGFNIAADMAINCHVEGLPPNCIYPKNYGLPDNEGSEWYYSKLKEEAEKNGTEVGEGEGRGELVDSHDMWGEMDDDIIKEKVREIADKAIRAQESKSFGDISGSLVQQILAANKPIVNWKKQVKYFIHQIVMQGRKATRMRPNRRFGYQNPGNKRDYISKILVAIDTSGSVSDELLSHFLVELNGMIAHVKVDMLQFDHEIKMEPKPFTKKQTTFKCLGRGGTAVDPVLRLVDDRHYDGVIICTDGGFSIGVPKPKARVMWCGVVADQQCFNHIQFGKKVFIEKKKN